LIFKLDMKALMIIGSLCPISAEGVIRGLRWGIGPKGAEAFPSHHIKQYWMDRRMDGHMYGRRDIQTYKMNVHT
jgi:hypothetical protein